MIRYPDLPAFEAVPAPRLQFFNPASRGYSAETRILQVPHEIPKQLLAWLRQLLPKQKNSGSGVVQVGKAGDVTVVNITNHTMHMPHIHANAGHRLSPVPVSTPKRQATTAQREVLDMMKLLDEREGLVLDFMQREFGTRRVIDLTDAQLYRVRRYVEVSLKRGRG
jgi:hypothetical protein